MSKYFNPYSDQSFFSFFNIFFHRLWELCTGTLSQKELFSDEVQMCVLCGVAVSGALVGTFLILRKMTMLANALSHTILLGIVTAYLLVTAFGAVHHPQETMTVPILVLASLITGIMTTFLTELLHRHLKLQEDASIGLVFTALFAAGILIVTLFTRNVHVGTELIMGNVDGLQKNDIHSVFVVLAGNMLFCTLFFKGFKITTFDAGLSRALGFSPIFYNYLLMILTSATAISAFRAVGVLMVLAFFVLPPLTARLLTDRLGVLLFLAMGIGCCGSFVGVAFSRHLLTTYHIGLSTGGIVVCTLLVFFVAALIFSPRSGWIVYLRRRRQLKQKYIKES